MKNTTNQHHKGKKAALLALAFPLVLAGAPVQAAQRTYVASETALPSPQIVGIKKTQSDSCRSFVCQQPTHDTGFLR